MAGLGALLGKLGSAGIGDIIKPVAGLIDGLSTSGEERGELRLALKSMQSALTAGVLSYESDLIGAQRAVVVAEAQGTSWLQRNWRPITMLVFTFIVAWNYVLAPLLGYFFQGMPLLEIPPGMWTLLQIGLGGYVVGRSGEKIANTLTQGKLDFSKGRGGTNANNKRGRRRGKNKEDNG